MQTVSADQRGQGSFSPYMAEEGTGRIIRIKERKVKGFGEIERKTKVDCDFQFSCE